MTSSDGPRNGFAADLRALTAEFHAFQKLMDERDRRYSEGKEGDQRAVSAALAANEKLTSAAFAASKEAITKAESNQTTYNATHNDLTRKMDAQYKDMLPRTEADSRFAAQEEKIQDLRESRSATTGAGAAIDKMSEASHKTMWAVIGIGVTVVIFIVGTLLR